MTIYIPVLTLPSEPLTTLGLAAFILLGISILGFIFFWLWSVIHAYRTPRAPYGQRLFWALAILLNPTATIWYWCVWQRWAFWTLFTPLIGIFLALPFVVRSLMSKADATLITNSLFALGSNALVIFFAILLIFPIILRLMAILHLTKSTDISALEKNDWVVTLAFPSIGYGVALFYCVRHIRSWAFAGMGWMVILIIVSKIMFMNLAPSIIPAGEERREEYKAIKNSTTTEVMELEKE
ncbi:MAG: hypothetical protein P1P90_02775 [Patescibacteria group bacterium]|nr:hypothetical protein [Patescibacteria group bacterium]